MRVAKSRLYFLTCRNDRNYGGKRDKHRRMKKSKKKEKAEKLVKDIMFREIEGEAEIKQRTAIQCEKNNLLKQSY